MPLDWARLNVSGMIGELVNKYKAVTSTLEWGMDERYFENSSIQTRAKLGDPILDRGGKKVEKKGICHHLKESWGLFESSWRSLESSTQWFYLYFNKMTVRGIEKLLD